MTTPKTKTRRATREKPADQHIGPAPAKPEVVRLRELLAIAETDVRNTRSLLQTARSEIAIVRRELAEAREQAERPWWRRIFDWMAP